MSLSPCPSDSSIFPTSVLVIGAGGHGRVVAELARACDHSRVVFADDRSPLAIGTLTDFPALAQRHSSVAVSPGDLPLLDRLESFSVPIPASCAPLVHRQPFRPVCDYAEALNGFRPLLK